MSRCFPFPPPGYEKKLRSDLVDFLTKEKSKEKEHKKKEKREKEKREGKERKDKHKDKDRSKDKHTEKKDKKEKHRDKSKKKGKDRDKGSEKVLNERNGQGHTGGRKEETLAEGRKADINRDSSFTEESVTSIREGENGAAHQMGKQITTESQRLENTCNSAEKGRNMGGEMVHNVTVLEQKRTVIASAMENRGTGNAMPRVTEQRKIDGMGRSTDMDAKKGVEAKEKAKEGKVDGRKGEGDKNKATDREKKHKRKDKDRDKEKAKEEKRREKEERKYKEQGKSVGIEQKGHVDLQNVQSFANPQENKNSTGAETSLKRKDINGFLHEKEVRPNKLSRPASSSQHPLENGRKLDLSQVTTQCASDRHEGVNLKAEGILESKEHTINGAIDVQPHSKSGPPPIVGAMGSGESFKKPSHPDEKYLNQILCLPKMETWPEFDDQEWLLSRDDARQKPKTEPKGDGMPQVWDKALQIDAADVLALPYVVPY